MKSGPVNDCKLNFGHDVVGLIAATRLKHEVVAILQHSKIMLCISMFKVNLLYRIHSGGRLS